MLPRLLPTSPATWTGDLMGASEEPWFVVRPGAQRRDKIIHLPLMYMGRDNLTDVEISVRDQKHVVGLSTEGGPAYDWIDEVGDLASGDEFRVTILIEDTEDRLKFHLRLFVTSVVCAP